jgi:hypothetical protein
MAAPPQAPSPAASQSPQQSPSPAASQSPASTPPAQPSPSQSPPTDAPTLMPSSSPTVGIDQQASAAVASADKQILDLTSQSNSEAQQYYKEAQLLAQGQMPGNGSGNGNGGTGNGNGGSGNGGLKTNASAVAALVNGNSQATGSGTIVGGGSSGPPGGSALGGVLPNHSSTLSASSTAARSVAEIYGGGGGGGPMADLAAVDAASPQPAKGTARIRAANRQAQLAEQVGPSPGSGTASGNGSGLSLDLASDGETGSPGLHLTMDESSTSGTSRSGVPPPAGTAGASNVTRATARTMVYAPPALQVVLRKIQPHVLGSTPSLRYRLPGSLPITGPYH